MLIKSYQVATLFLVCACNDQLDIQQIYPFTVTTIPIQKSIKVGETAEIPFQLHREGINEETETASGIFSRIVDGTAFLPNDLYPLPGETMRMNHNSVFY